MGAALEGFSSSQMGAESMLIGTARTADIVADILAHRRGRRIATVDVGRRALCRALAQNGRRRGGVVEALLLELTQGSVAPLESSVHVKQSVG